VNEEGGKGSDFVVAKSLRILGVFLAPAWAPDVVEAYWWAGAEREGSACCWANLDSAARVFLI